MGGKGGLGPLAFRRATPMANDIIQPRLPRPDPGASLPPKIPKLNADSFVPSKQSERIVNTWFRDERSKRKKEGIAASRAQVTTAAAATHSRPSAIARGPSDDADETDMENEDDELMDDDDQPPNPPPSKDNNRQSDVSVYALPGPSTPYHPSLYDYSPAHLGAYQEKVSRTPSLPQSSPPLVVRQLNGTRFGNVVLEQLRTHRALHTSGAAPANHLLSPAYLPSELSSVSEHDGERMFDALSHSPMTNIGPSPVRSEMSLPATPLQNDPPLPISLPPVGSLTHPPEGGWTSSWRWSFYGHTSSMRATLEPAKWTPESSDSESVLGLENLNPVSIRVSDYDKYDKPFDAGVKRSPFAPAPPQ